MAFHAVVAGEQSIDLPIRQICPNLLVHRTPRSRARRLGLHILFGLAFLRQLLLRLFVAMLYQSVQETARLSLGVTLCFGLLDLALDMACRFIVQVVLVFSLVEIGCTS